MKFRTLPDPSLLRKLVRYEPDTGKLYWLPRSPDMFNVTEGRYSRQTACKVWNTKNAGNEAFRNPHRERHFSGSVLGEVHLAHRVAWAIHHGTSEFGLIDHKNGNGLDNRITNLRLANSQLNAQNARRRKDCSSGVTGVHWHIDKRWGRPCWAVRIQVGGRRLFLGTFADLNEAIACRRAAEIKYGFGVAHGKAKP
ncbi:MAG: HNH endonuclease signature motif containing protein [Novosphingobium sp.]|nr:HNH endonuclease signature motif containing protein [Novosphingobium sp.]